MRAPGKLGSAVEETNCAKDSNPLRSAMFALLPGTETPIAFKENSCVLNHE